MGRGTNLGKETKGSVEHDHEHQSSQPLRRAVPNVPSIKEDPGHEPRHESPDGPRRPRADALWMANDHGATAAHSGNQIQNQVAQSPPHCFLDSADDEQ